jgi:hypothetical protein
MRLNEFAKGPKCMDMALNAFFDLPTIRVVVSRSKAIVALGLIVASCGSPSSPMPNTEGEAELVPPQETPPPDVEIPEKIDRRLLFKAGETKPKDVLVLMNEHVMQSPFEDVSVGFPQDNQQQLRALRMKKAKAQFATRMGSQNIETVTQYENVPMIHVRIGSAEAMSTVAADPAVVKLVPDEEYGLLEAPSPALSLIRQPAVAELGNRGEGTAVVVIDTGVDFKRAPFNCAAAGDANCSVVYSADIAPTDNNVDDSGHGTNVTGIVLSVAPAAKLIALDVFRGTAALTSDILSAIDWSIQNKVKYNIVALNMSLGGGSFTAPCAQDALAVGVASARTSGILVAAAAGNNGRSNALVSPACGPASISVGAVHSSTGRDFNWVTCVDTKLKADEVACFSSSATFLTMLAPGILISAGGITMSGTSQAAPHVAGAIAVLSASFPDESANSIATRLKVSGVPLKDPRNGVTTPRLDLWAAFKAAKPTPVPGPVGTLLLDNGATFSKSSIVIASLANTAGRPVQVCVSEGLKCANWMSVAASTPVQLSAGDGLKTVRAWWRDVDGNMSLQPAVASIFVDTTSPTNGVLISTVTASRLDFSWTGVSDSGSMIHAHRLVTSTTSAISPGCPGVADYEGIATSFFKSFTTSATVYSRLCSIDKAGNVSAGSSASIVVTAPRPVLISGNDRTLQVGSIASGTAFEDACPAGQALIGFSGSTSDATAKAVHTQISARCGIVQVSNSIVTVSSGESMPSRGTSGAVPWSRECPTDQVIIGVTGNAGIALDRLGFSCAKLNISGSNAGAALTVGAARNIDPVGGTNEAAFNATCPKGEIATVARSRTNPSLSAFGFSCGFPTLGP